MTSDAAVAKKVLRKEMRARRAALGPAQKQAYDQALREHLAQAIKTAAPAALHIYLPMKTEPDLWPLWAALLAQGQKLICPVALPGGQLEHRLLRDLADLEPGPIGTRHPRGPAYTEAPDWILLPGLAFDEQGRRLGYGGGYYDRFLARFTASVRVAVAYPFQYLLAVPTEPNDQPIDRLFLPSGEIALAAR